MTSKTLLLLFLLAVSIYVNASPFQHLHSDKTNFQIRETLFLTPLTYSFPSLLPFVHLNFLQSGIENRFLLPEITTKQFMGHLNYKENSFVLQCDHFGYSKFGLLETSMGYARRFGKSIAFSVNFHHLFNHADKYDARHSFTFSVSFWGKIGPKHGIGISVYNPARLDYGGLSREPIPVRFHIVGTYKVNDKVMLIPEIYKEFPGYLNIKLGSAIIHKDFKFTNSISLRGIGCGIGFLYSKFFFELDTQYDYQLGFCPKAMITYILHK